MITKTITSVPEFHEAVRSTWNMVPVYRGENSSTYELRSSIGRLLHVNPVFNTRGREASMFRDFQKWSVPHLRHKPSNAWEWMALAQHHGLPTRLLDWSKNPLVAAYFCCQPRKMMKDDGVIYCFDEAQIQDADEGTDPLALTADVVYKPPHLSTRFVAQMGLFTVHHSPGSIFAHPTLQRWVVKRKCMIELLISAEIYGVTTASLFPDLDGLCRSLRDSWTTDAHDTSTPPASPTATK